MTGAQRGIGQAIARALACSEHDVVVADLHTQNSASWFREQWGCRGRVYCLEVDISDEGSVCSLFDQIQALGLSVPDVLINNAATQVWGPLIDMSLDDWNRTLAVNITGTFLMTREFARRQREVSETHGAIVNMGSGCNHLAFPDLAAYVSSKGAVEMFTKAASLELGKQGIRVNCVAPGAIETDRTQSETDNYADSWAPVTPLNRVGTVNDVANAVVALVGENMGFVSGETIRVDGGLFGRSVWPESY